MAFRTVLGALAITASFLPVDALFWTATVRYQYYMSIETDTYTWRTTDPYVYYTYTSTATLNSGITPTEAPLSSTTSYDTYQNLELVSLYYQTGAVPDSDLEPTTTETVTTTTTTTTTYTAYVMSITYTPPASCSKTWKVPTTVSVHIPTEVVDQVTPVTIVTDPGYTITYSTGFYTAAPWVTWLLSDGAAPLTTTGYYADYYYTRDIYNCRKPGSSSSSNYDAGDLQVCTLYSGCTSLKTWIIIVATLLSTLFVLGWIESYFWFRRLMTGRSALRFGTVCWILISLWVLCFTRRQKARPSQDQAYLKQQWKQMSFWRRIKLWFKWGFRHAYPAALLGEYVPPAPTVVYRSGQPIRAGGGGTGGYGPPPGMPPPAYTSEAGRNIEAIQPMPPPEPYVPGNDEEKGLGKEEPSVQEIPGHEIPHEASGREIPHEAPSGVPSDPPPSKQQ